MMGTEKWYLDGREVKKQEYDRAVNSVTVPRDDGPDSSAKTTGEIADHHVAVHSGEKEIPGQISHYHLATAGEPNIYTYVNQNPWSKFDPLGLDATFTFNNGQKPVTVKTAKDFVKTAQAAKPGTIKDITITRSHGIPEDEKTLGVGQNIGRGESGDQIKNGTDGRPKVGNPLTGDPFNVDLGKLLDGKFAKDATFHYEGCHTADQKNPNNIAKTTSDALPGVNVSGTEWNSRGSVPFWDGSPTIVTPFTTEHYVDGEKK